MCVCEDLKKRLDKIKKIEKVNFITFFGYSSYILSEDSTYRFSLAALNCRWNKNGPALFSFKCRYILGLGLSLFWDSLWILEMALLLRYLL